MEHIGIDVHKVESQICILTESGEVVERRIRTQRERFAAVLGERPQAKVLIEASTESEWVARCLEELGHGVVLADPNFAAMYPTRSHKVKTDQLRHSRRRVCSGERQRALRRTGDALRRRRDGSTSPRRCASRAAAAPETDGGASQRETHGCTRRRTSRGDACAGDLAARHRTREEARGVPPRFFIAFSSTRPGFNGPPVSPTHSGRTSGRGLAGRPSPRCSNRRAERRRRDTARLYALNSPCSGAA
jgi:hypothetical protein